MSLWMQLQNRQPVLVTLPPSTLTPDTAGDGTNRESVMAFHALVAYHSQYITNKNASTGNEGIVYKDMEQITQWRMKTPEGQIIPPDTLIPVILNADTNTAANDIAGTSHVLGCTASNALQIEWISERSRRRYEGAGVDYGQTSAQCWCCVGGTKGN